EPVNERSIEGLSVVPDVKGGKVTLTAKVRGEAKGLSVKWVPAAPDKGGDLAASKSTPGEAHERELREPVLWSPEKPALYGLTVSLFDGDKEIDRVSSYFAVREVKLDQDKDGATRIFVNGKPYFQVGLLDQGFWPDGLYTAPTDEARK